MPIEAKLFSCWLYRKVEALGGHLFVLGQVGDADIEKINNAMQSAWAKRFYGEIFRQIGDILLPIV